MQKTKIYAFRGYGQFCFFNHKELNCFDDTTFNWVGGSWLVYEENYIIANYYQMLADNGLSALTSDEFKSVIESLKEHDKDFADYLSNCELCNGEPMETLFEKHIKDIDITIETKLEDLPSNAHFWDYNCNGEPMVQSINEFKNILLYGGDNSDFVGHYMMIY